MFCKKCGTEISGNMKFCKRCGNPLPVVIKTTASVTPSESEPKVKSVSEVNIFFRVLGRMVKSALGRIAIYIVLYLVSLGLVALAIEIPFTAPIIVIFAILYGWRFIDFLTPAMFVWMPLAGWLIYFTVKFFVSGILGLFIIPYKLAKKIIYEYSAYDYDE